MNNKAAIEVQFNWIFVMIVGFVLFLFIIGIVIYQTTKAEGGMSSNVLSQILTAIRGKQQLTNTYNEITIPYSEIEISCDINTLLSDIKRSDTQRLSLPVEIIFSPRTIATNKIILITQDFSMPFVVTRFIYMTSSDYTYIINDDINNNNDEMIYDIFDKDIGGNISRAKTGGINTLTKLVKEHPKNKIICTTNCPAQTYDYIQIIPENGYDMFEYGTVKYHRKNSIDKTTHYITEQGLIGAIFSDNENYYDCQMRRVFEQFEIKRGLYQERTGILENELAIANPECVEVMIRPYSTLEKMTDKGISDYEELYKLSDDLIKDNQVLMFKSCPVIY